MDTADYDTNILLLNNIASVVYRVYELSTDQHQSFGLKAVEIERRLREEGHNVFYDATRRGIWHFRTLTKDSEDRVNALGSETSLDIQGYPLTVGEEGTFEPTNIQRPRLSLQQTGHTPTSSTSSAPASETAQRNESHDPALAPVDVIRNGQGSSTNSRTPYENFIIATLMTISSVFSHRTGAIPLDFQTFLLPRSLTRYEASDDVVSERASTIGTVRAYMTTTGVLVVSMGVSTCRGLLSMNDVLNQGLREPGKRILAAPFGIIASSPSSVSLDGGTASMVQTPNTQALSLRGGLDNTSFLRTTCLSFLQHRGIALSNLTNHFWVNLIVSRPKSHDAKIDPKRLQMHNPTVSIPWPSPLCFRKKPVDVPFTSRVSETTLSGHEESHDPLGSAQAWFSSANEREEKFSKRKTERVVSSQDTNHNDSRSLKPNGQSPFSWRHPNTVATGSMYPTPPDALQNFNGVTPSLDGNLSSPGNPLSGAAVPDAENAPNPASTMSGLFESAPDPTESKRQRSESNPLGEAESMFGEISGDMFGDNDMTEADFSFFDEGPSDLDLDVTMDNLGDEAVAEPGDVADTQPSKGERLSNGRDREAEPEKGAVVFTKPELRHAIGAKNDISAQWERDKNGSLSAKRDSSPFDPHTVFKRVCASMAAAERERENSGMTRIFERMDFDPTLPMIDKKYEKGGHFDVGKELSEESKLDFEADHLSRRRRQSRTRPEDYRLHASSLIRPFAAPQPTHATGSPTAFGPHVLDDDLSSVESDPDDSSCNYNHEPASPVRSSMKQAAADDDVMSHVTSLKEMDAMDDADHQLAAELPRLGKPETCGTPIAALFSDPEPLSLELSLNDEDLIQVAQILTEQAALGTLHLSPTRDECQTSGLIEQNRQSLLVDARASLQILREVTSSFFPGIEPARLKGFLDVQDVSSQGQPTRLQPRPIPGRDANAEQMRPSNLYPIPGPHLEVRRADTNLSVLPSAITFWESLGFSPSSGTKDITAACVFPGWKGMNDQAKTFLGRVKSIYEVLKLGSVDTLSMSPDLEDGILPYELDRISTSPDATLTGHGSALVGSMETLRGALNNLTVMETNVVVFLVYSPNNPGTIVEACSAFHRLFDLYQKELLERREPAVNELVLQLVSADLLSSPTSLVVTSSPELVKLCMETYDRCTLFGGPMPAPAIRLEQPPSRIIDFKLSQTPSASLIRENSCVHVAYAQTVDERWVSAAWTDDRGNQQATASYCLRRKDKTPSRSFSEVARDIWESTLDLISAWKVHWKIIITKCGPMHQDEMECWVDLARTEMTASVAMILMTAHTNPSLQLVPPVVKLPQSIVSFYTTPVSTPQTNIVSPEQSATPATPGDAGFDADSDAVLADVTDQIWGAIVGHRLNNSQSVIDVHPALVSGYLIKRTGARVEDAPVAMEVNLVHTDSSPRSYEPLLREMLSYFRGLATLSRARGMVPKDTDVRSWHIAAAEKAAQAVYLLM